MDGTVDLGAKIARGTFVGTNINDIPPEMLQNVVDKMDPEDAFAFSKTGSKYRQMVTRRKNKICDKYLEDKNIGDICSESMEASHRWCRETSNLCNKVFTDLDNLIDLGGGVYQIPDGTVVIGYRLNDDADDYDHIREVIIPNSVTKIMKWAFSEWRNLVNVAIPDSVTEIGHEAFKECTSLASITIPDSVTKIGFEAFKECTSLASITIPDTITKIEEKTFSNCTSLTLVTIPDSVAKIESNAFEDCTSLTSVIIPDSVTNIESYAFADCTSLTSVTIPDSVTSLGRGIFIDCTNLRSITVPAGNNLISVIGG
jgi:hypothetical protein